MGAAAVAPCVPFACCAVSELRSERASSEHADGRAAAALPPGRRPEGLRPREHAPHRGCTRRFPKLGHLAARARAGTREFASIASTRSLVLGKIGQRHRKCSDPSGEARRQLPPLPRGDRNETVRWPPTREFARRRHPHPSTPVQANACSCPQQHAAHARTKRRPPARRCATPPWQGIDGWCRAYTATRRERVECTYTQHRTSRQSCQTACSARAARFPNWSPGCSPRRRRCSSRRPSPLAHAAAPSPRSGAVESEWTHKHSRYDIHGSKGVPHNACAAFVGRPPARAP